MISKSFTPAPNPARALAKAEAVALVIDGYPSNKVNYTGRPIGPTQTNIAFETPTVNTVSGTET